MEKETSPMRTTLSQREGSTTSQETTPTLKPRKQELLFNGETYLYSRPGRLFTHVIDMRSPPRHHWELVNGGWRKSVIDPNLVADLELALHSSLADLQLKSDSRARARANHKLQGLQNDWDLNQQKRTLTRKSNGKIFCFSKEREKWGAPKEWYDGAFAITDYSLKSELRSALQKIAALKRQVAEGTR